MAYGTTFNTEIYIPQLAMVKLDEVAVLDVESRGLPAFVKDRTLKLTQRPFSRSHHPAFTKLGKAWSAHQEDFEVAHPVQFAVTGPKGKPARSIYIKPPDGAGPYPPPGDYWDGWLDKDKVYAGVSLEEALVWLRKERTGALYLAAFNAPFDYTVLMAAARRTFRYATGIRDWLVYSKWIDIQRCASLAANDEHFKLAGPMRYDKMPRCCDAYEAITGEEPPQGLHDAGVDVKVEQSMLEKTLTYSRMNVATQKSVGIWYPVATNGRSVAVTNAGESQAPKRHADEPARNRFAYQRFAGSNLQNTSR